MAKILLRRRVVEARTGLGHSKIYEGISEGSFPAPVKLTPKAARWVEDEIDDWIAARIAERDAKAA